MTRKSKRILSRILAVILAVTLVPSNMWGTANVVRAEETTEAFTEEDVDVSTENVSTKIVQEPQEEVGEKETSEPSVVADDGKDSDSAPVDAEETLEDDKKPEVKPEKKETEKVSTETDNKGILKTEYVHNFTTDGTTSRSIFTIAGDTGTTSGTYTDKDGNVLSFNTVLKTNSKGLVTVKAPTSGTLIVVKSTDDKTISIGGQTFSSDTNGVIETSIKAGDCEIKKGSGESKIFYIAFIPEGADKPQVKDLEAKPTVDTEVKVGDTITLSCSPEDAIIYYTTDGTDPKDNADKKTYSDGITVETTMVSDGKITIKAYASKPDEYADSETVTFSYNVSTEAGENQLKMPTAEPDAGEVPKGTEVKLKSDDSAPIYYTKDGTIPSKDNGTLFAESNPIIINEETVIKAIAKDGVKSDSFVASFTYTIKKPTIKVNDDTFSKSVISEVALDGDITFTNGTEEVFDISLKAKENTTPDGTVKTAAEGIKEESGKILYYDFSLVNNKSTSDTVSIADDATGTFKIKMPYTIASDVNKRNNITVVNATGEIEPSKDSAGFVFDADSIGTYAVVINPAGATGSIKILESEGYEEGAYAEWEAVEDADGYMAYVAPAGGKYVRIDDELIREYDNYWRVDTVGLAKGTYYIKIKAVVLGKDGDMDTATVISSAETDELRVTNYDRSGFAFSSKSTYKTGSGAYNDDGTLREGAQVIYVTAKTAKTVTAKLHTAGPNNPAVEYTGLQTILDSKNKGDYTKDDILDIRIIGCVTKDDLDHISSSAEGLQVKGKNAYSEMNITLEGIGEDAVVNGFGFLIRNCGNVELRNFGILNFMDDGVSMDTDNCNIWAHDLDIFYGSEGGDSDQAKGDGSIDVKAGSTYVTISYNHFWDSGKCSLCGMEDSKADEFMVTYHHNWFDHSDSRHARVRRGTVHLYNNYYDGNAKYGVGAANASSLFVEANYFRNCNYPMIISTQASDALGGDIMSGEDGGIIKAYNNVITGAKNLVYQNSNNGTSAANSTSFDAYFVANRADTVPSTVKTLTGGTSYNNFDTSSSYDLGVKEENIDTPENVPTVVMAKAGRLNGGDFKWEFDNAKEDTNYSIISALKTKVTNYTTSVKKISCGIAKDIVVIEDAGSNTPGGNTQTVNPPTANKTSGEVPEDTEITLSSSNSGDVKIYYTLNGLEPTVKSGTLYRDTEPIVIRKETTIKAIAVVGTSVSSVATFKYTIPGGTTPTPPPGPSGDDDDKPARGTYTLDIKDAYDTTVPNATETRQETKGTKEFFTLLFLGKTSNGVAAGSAISEKSSELEFEDGYKSNRYFLTSGAAKTNQASVKIVTKDKTTVTVWWQPGGTSDLNQRQLTVLNASGTAVYTSEYDSLSTEVGYVTSFELANAGTYYIGSAKSSINIYKIEVKYPDNGGSGNEGDSGLVESPTATPGGGNIKQGGAVRLEAAGDIYYTMTTNGNEPAKPTTSSDKYTTPITITAEVGATVKIKAIAVSDGKESDPSLFTYTVIKDEDNPNPTPPTEKLSVPEASPAPDANETYPVGVKISLTSKEDGTIYYTLDNTEPQKANGEPSETSQVLAENGIITLDTAKAYTIKAFAVKDGYLPSDTATFTYTVSDNSTMTQLVAPTIAPASKEVEKGDEVTVTITEAANSPAGTEIYYTTDGTSPSKTNGQHYTKEFSLTVNETTTVTAIAINDNAIPSPTVSVTYTVKSTSSKVGLWVELKNKNKNYIYTGSAIKPDIVVGNYDDILVEGVDYTVAYKNNINASTDAAPNKKPQITVTGKGNLTGKATTTFEIKQRPLDEVVVTGVEKNGSDNMLLVVENTKPAPVLYYGGAKLGKKDFTVSVTDKCTTANDGDTITISGQGNFTDPLSGVLTYKIKVIKKDQLKKFKVTFTDPGYTYKEGTSQTITLADDAVTDSSKTDTDGRSLEVGTDYTIVYQNDTINAGKVKFTVVGLGYYTGAVTKTYTIKPIVATSGFEFTGVPVSHEYVGTGVTIPGVGITYTDENGKLHTLEQGKDYKLAYGNNKKVGTAKISATFMGNYKGSKTEPATFTIGLCTLTNQTTDIVIPDKVYNKPGVYKSVPYVSVNGVEVKSSEYTVKYYTDGQVAADGTITVNTDTEMGSKNRIEISDTDTNNFKPVYVEITGKGKNYTTGDTPLTASYNVRKMPESANALDLSKAKVTVYKGWSVDENTDAATNKAMKSNKMEYTGVAIEPGVMIEIKNGKETTTLYPKDVEKLLKGQNPELTVQYVNNVNKGKATIVINGDGENYVGSKTVTFSITTKNLKDTEILKNLFGDISRIIKGDQ